MVSWYSVIAFSMVSAAAGFVLAMFLLEKKVSSLEKQLLESQSKCEKCNEHAKYMAAKADCEAILEDRDRLVRSNNQYRGYVQRLAAKLKQRAA